MENVTSMYSRHDLSDLYKIAIQFVRSEQKALGVSLQMSPFSVFYRCMADSELQVDLHDGIMKKRIKNKGGHENCPLNKTRFKALLFSSALENGALPTSSSLGDRRMVIPATYLLNPHFHHLYFADFYCDNRVREPHYITLVSCLKNSGADVFCKRYLLTLPLDRNRLLLVDEGEYKQSLVKTVKIELFYTENVPINLCSEPETICLATGATARRNSSFNKECTFCNMLEGIASPDITKAESEEQEDEPVFSPLDALKPGGSIAAISAMSAYPRQSSTQSGYTNLTLLAKRGRTESKKSMSSRVRRAMRIVCCCECC